MELKLRTQIIELLKQATKNTKKFIKNYKNKNKYYEIVYNFLTGNLIGDEVINTFEEDKELLSIFYKYYKYVESGNKFKVKVLLQYSEYVDEFNYLPGDIYINIPIELLNNPKYIKRMLNNKIITNNYKKITNTNCINLIKKSIIKNSSLFINDYPKKIIKFLVKHKEFDYPNLTNINKSHMNDSIIEYYKVFGLDTFISSLNEKNNLPTKLLKNKNFELDLEIKEEEEKTLNKLYLNVNDLPKVISPEILNKLIDQIDYIDKVNLNVFRTYKKYGLLGRMFEKFYVYKPNTKKLNDDERRININTVLRLPDNEFLQSTIVEFVTEELYALYNEKEIIVMNETDYKIILCIYKKTPNYVDYILSKNHSKILCKFAMMSNIKYQIKDIILNNIVIHSNYLSIEKLEKYNRYLWKKKDILESINEDLII